MLIPVLSSKNYFMCLVGGQALKLLECIFCCQNKSNQIRGQTLKKCLPPRNLFEGTSTPKF